ncbi:MAG: GDP-mannose 4,6-dehydratase [Candidatus Staskawiczbacteria bacterium]|nr:GDP-mannose 4,6-dehydratase [Candidatus Staskawiczbacteria bacterium]MBI3337221.1 GDP-mannose 4,6-dehydratase [Candidatus Staskawiczbacteria bacterium]
MKKVLITGGAGFVGANFVYTFVDLKYNVHIIEKSGTDLWRINKIKNKVKIHYIDLKEYKNVEACVLKIKPHIILHFAAYGAYQGKQQDIENTITTNLLGTINLANACAKTKFTCFINTGTSSEYGLKDTVMKETDILEPNNLYGITKSAATMYCFYMAKYKNLPIATVRPFSAYGYFEEKGRLVPTIIKACLENSPLKLYSPNSVRDFIFIEDLINAYMLIIKNIKKIKGEVFNIGSGKQNTVEEVFKITKKITGSKIQPIYDQVKQNQYEPKKWVADISKAKKMLHWKPKHDLGQGLQKNTAWFKKNLSLYGSY